MQVVLARNPFLNLNMSRSHVGKYSFCWLSSFFRFSSCRKDLRLNLCSSRILEICHFLCLNISSLLIVCSPIACRHFEYIMKSFEPVPCSTHTFEDISIFIFFVEFYEYLRLIHNCLLHHLLYPNAH